MVPGRASQIARQTIETSDGVTLSLLEVGRDRRSGLTIVVVPGWLMPAAIWRNQLEEWGKHFPALAMDPRGQGESAVARAGYTAERRATDIKEVLEPLSNVLLVAWSLGAIEALQYIHMFGDEKLAGLALVDSSVGEHPAPPPGESFLQALREDRDHTLENFVRAIFKTPRTESEVAALVAGAKRLAVEDSIALLSYPFPRKHWNDIVHRFTKPLLYAVTPQYEEQARNLQKRRPATKVEIFRRAGHALFADEPGRFNMLIEGFARRLPPPPR
jgi:non-heme chloroperoxidase